MTYNVLSRTLSLYTTTTNTTTTTTTTTTTDIEQTGNITGRILLLSWQHDNDDTDWNCNNDWYCCVRYCPMATFDHKLNIYSHVLNICWKLYASRWRETQRHRCVCLTFPHIVFFYLSLNGETMFGYFWDWWWYFAGKLSWNITTTQVNSALHPYRFAKLSTSFGWGKGGKVTVAGWQVTLCDPIWHLVYRSGVMILITNCLIFTFYWLVPFTLVNKLNKNDLSLCLKQSIWQIYSQMEECSIQ